MKRIAASVLVLAALAGCGEEEEPDYLVEYQIGMSSMEVIPPASPNEPLSVRLTGIIGPDSRYAFDHAVIDETAASYELTLFGVRNEDPDAVFLPVVIEWVGREFLKQPPHASSVEVILHQPDGSVLKEVVPIPGP